MIEVSAKATVATILQYVNISNPHMYYKCEIYKRIAQHDKFGFIPGIQIGLTLENQLMRIHYINS